MIMSGILVTNRNRKYLAAMSGDHLVRDTRTAAADMGGTSRIRITPPKE